VLERIPSAEEMQELLGEELFCVWEKLTSAIDEKYEMDRLWDKGYHDWRYEYKYRRGGKTLVTLYAKERTIGVQIIFGKDERVKVEANRENLSDQALRAYDEAQTYHDGKWVMFFPKDDGMIGDFMKLMALKRRPNRK